MTALLLSLMMMFPTQGMEAFADTVPVVASEIQIGAEESGVQAEPEADTETADSAGREDSAEAEGGINTEEMSSAQETAAGISGVETETPEETLEAETSREEAGETYPEAESPVGDRIEETLPLEPLKPEAGGQEGALGGQSGAGGVQGGDRIEETLPLEPLEPETGSQVGGSGGQSGSGSGQGGDRMEGLLPLEPVKEQLSLDGLSEIYWNPGGTIPAEFKKSITATSSNADSSSDIDSDTNLDSNRESDTGTDSETGTDLSIDAESGAGTQIPKGSDGANGFTPEHPVKSLEKALKQAEKLAESNHLDLSDITIYAMNPMEIPDGTMYVLNTANMRIVSWPERGYDNDTIFYINGGQLALINTSLEAGGGAAKPEEAELVHVYGGALQLGQNARIDGRIVMDYRKDREAAAWEKATEADAEKAKGTSDIAETAGAVGFDLNHYIVSTDETEWDIIRDESETSTWREPIIELMEGFNGTEGSYLLELKSDRLKNDITLVKTLYADETEPEEFAGYFRLADTAAEEWELVPESEETASVYDTGAELLKQYYQAVLMTENGTETGGAAVPLTVKTLSAVPLSADSIVYWNPGGAITIGDTIYPAGTDEGNAGGYVGRPVKSLKHAVEMADGGTVVCMRTLTLGDGADQYLWEEGRDGDGIFWAKSSASGNKVTIIPWESTLQPLFRVPYGEKLGLENIILAGIGAGGVPAGSQAVICEGGDIVIGSDVTAETGYIHINASSDPDKDLAKHPVKVRDASTGGRITLFFGGIRDDLSYRYTDVVVPDGALKIEAELDGDHAKDVGTSLYNRFRLLESSAFDHEEQNKGIAWKLRRDTGEDDGFETPQNLELYVDYYFDAVYVNGKNGDDTVNYGATCRFPVKTFEKAKEILQEQVRKSRSKRAEAHAAGLSRSEIDEKYPLATVIYVCDTLTVKQPTTWRLDDLTNEDGTPLSDYDGTLIQAELVSHVDHIPNKDDGTPVHKPVLSMIDYESTGDFILENIVIRSIVDQGDSFTVRVKSGSLTVKGSARLTGARAEWEEEEAGITDAETLKTKYARVSRGTHVWVEDGAKFNMPSDWTGYIERGGRGVFAGGNARVEMAGGEIRRNNGLDKELSEYGQIKGAGVCLTDSAAMDMNGGRITENLVYSKGGGISVEGQGTLYISKGEISKNGMSQFLQLGAASTYNPPRVIGYGIGIYGGEGTSITIGSGTDVELGDIRIERNESYQSYGTGIYSAGTTRIVKTIIAGNTSDPNPQKGVTSSNSNINSRGIGLYVAGDVTQIRDSEITGNNTRNRPGLNGRDEIAYGAGIYVERNKSCRIINCLIKENRGGIGSGSNYSKGGGIYSDGSLQIENSVISSNRSYNGAGVYAYNGTVTITDTDVSDNQAANAATNSAAVTLDGYGGGIYTDLYAAVTLKGNSKVTGNKAGYGGGIYGNGFSSKTYLRGTVTQPILINNNQADRNGGGAGLSQQAKLYARYAEISGNEALKGDGNGGGIYTNTPGDSYLRDVKITGNRSLNGGGIYYGSNNSGLSWYMTDVQIKDNTAQMEGGGLYRSGEGPVYFDETASGKSALSGNEARDGGGIFNASGTEKTFLAIQNISNKALRQGGNIYMSKGGLTLLKGTLGRPSETNADVYNIYVNAADRADGYVILDPQTVTVSKKAADDPKAVFLNTGGSYLKYLTAPTGLEPYTLPIDTNINVFRAGSVVIKPANTARIDVYQVSSTDMTAADAVPYLYPGLTSMADNLEYSMGGILPRRTMLGTDKDAATNPTLINAVLIGEGVYLASFGDDTAPGAGNSPVNPVKTFKKAKELLKDRIETSNRDDSDQDGFSPYIYICGNVAIGQDENWELDYTKPPFDKDSNLKFWTAEKDYVESQGKEFDEEDAQTQVRRLPSFVNQPMITVGAASGTVTFILDKIIIDGMTKSVIATDQDDKSPVITGDSHAEIIVKGNASIRKNYAYGIKMDGGKVILTGEEGDLNQQIRNIGGTFVYLGNGASIDMQGHSGIVRDKVITPSKDVYGIYADSNASVLMQGHSSIDNMMEGIRMKQSQIVEMENAAEIRNCSKGIHVMDAVNPNRIYMNMCSTAAEGDSAKITSADYGIYIEKQQGNLDVRMGKSAEISTSVDSGAGIYLGQSTMINKINKILMQDKSSITGFTGIKVDGSNAAIHMTDRAYITGCTKQGIQISGGDNQLLMEGNSQIGGNQKEGVYVTGTNSVYSRKLIMKDYAVIGGDTAYAAGQSNTGNGTHGVYFDNVYDGSITMEGHAAIKNNGNIGINIIDESGQGQGSVILSEDSSITANGTFPISTKSSENVWNITLKDRAAVKNNTNYVSIGDLTNLHLEDTVFIGKSQGNPEDKPKDRITDSIAISGNLYLDGSVTVEDNIWLKKAIAAGSTAASPITMTNKVTDPQKQPYRLKIAEAYMGGIVVQPDDPDNQHGGVTDLNDAPAQLRYFTKVAGEGLIADKVLMESGKNIVLQGNNDVYLSGTGLDTNNGMTPDSPVRTFKHARELLENGMFTTGARIIICGEVLVGKGDEDWSFDEGGTVTNQTTGATWKPVVIRWKQYDSGNLIRSYGYPNRPLTFSNITIDGGSEEGIITEVKADAAKNNGGALIVVDSSPVILGKGAVLQNNQVNIMGGNPTAGAVFLKKESLTLDGGTIRNISVEDKNGSAYSYGGAVIVGESMTNTGYDPHIYIKSGSITGNSVNSIGDAAVIKLDGIHVNSYQLEMSGGTISDNTLISTKSDTKNVNRAGGALVIKRGKATISGGAIRGNKGTRGSAIYYSTNSVYNQVILSGGLISNNISIDENGVERPAIKEHAAIYVGGYDFQLKGGGAAVSDKFYLSFRPATIKVSGNIYQTGRVYDVYTNMTPDVYGKDESYFKKGDAVVVPDGVWMKDVTPYLSNFRVLSPPYVLDRGQISRPVRDTSVSDIMENQSLILMKAVYLDSERGDDGNDGSMPAAAVKTFKKAKETGCSGAGSEDRKDYYIIYISGRVYNTAEETDWSANAPSYLCRYTGFDVYDNNGNKVSGIAQAYHGSLIDPDPAVNPNLTLKGIHIYGRRNIDSTINTGDSLVHVRDGVTVKIENENGDDTILGRNRNAGGYDDPEKSVSTELSHKGGAVQVEAGGRLEMLSGTIVDTEAAYGSAVYVGADETDPARLGELYITGSPSIGGNIFLEGTGSVTAAYIKADKNFNPGKALEVEIRNDYNHRPVIQYLNGEVPGVEELEKWKFSDSLQALYEIINRDAPEASILELYQRTPIYLDGQNGSDSNDGSTPEKAFKTLKRVYQAIEAKENSGQTEKGTAVLVVDTVELSQTTDQDVRLNNVIIKNPDGSYHYEGSYRDNSNSADPIEIHGQVYFKRYAKPDGYDAAQNIPGGIYEGFGKPTHKGSLFVVKDGGKLTLSGISLDGHSVESAGTSPTLTAGGVEAEAPLVTVTNGGELYCKVTEQTSVTGGIDTATLLINNVNINKKNKVIGTMDGNLVVEGSSAGIELLDLGSLAPGRPLAKAELVKTEFRNLKLGGGVTGGSDLYSDGELHISLFALFTGDVFLEGLGVKTNPATYATSRFIYADTYGFPVKDSLRITMRDPYDERTVIYYPDSTNPPDNREKELYLLEESIRERFFLNNRADRPETLELRMKAAVYIDGVSGIDNPDPSDVDPVKVGTTPKHPVKTLRRAFEMLRSIGGGTIYVVGNPIQIEGSVTLSGNSYSDENGLITLGETDKIRIVRYVTPDFARSGSTGDTAGSDDFKVISYSNNALMNVKPDAMINISNQVIFDGHSEPRNEKNDPKEIVVSKGIETEAPLITVQPGGRLEMAGGVTLQNNHNTGFGRVFDYIEGGAINNYGYVEAIGTVFENTTSHQGAAVYQYGTFVIRGNAEDPSLIFKGNTYEDNQFYLGAINNGTEESPVWEDCVISVEYPVPADRTGAQAFQVEMDHAVPGRDVVRFLDPLAYESDPAIPGCDPEHVHFRLGSTVPSGLFLVQSEEDEMVLELQNWRVLHVEVPQDIYLTLTENGQSSAGADLFGIRTGTSELFRTPQYQIVNRGRYDVSVELSGIDNTNAEAGITNDEMSLKDSPSDVAGNKDLYLAVKGLDGSGTDGFDMAETALTDTMAEAHMGKLKTGTAGNFEFTAAVGAGFVDKYMDRSFPLTDPPEEVQRYMDGTDITGSTAHAAAKYLLKFKVSLDSSRRKP